MRTPHNEAPQVGADSGEVHLDGPGIVGALTPEAAAEVGERIIAKACQAAGQRAQQACADEDRVMRHYGF